MGGEVWNIVDGGNDIYFLSEHHIHIYNKTGGGIITIDAIIKIDCSTLYRGRLYIGTPEGIFYLNDNNMLSKLSSSSVLKGEKLVSVLPYDNKLLVTTARKGLYLLEENKIEKITSIADDFIRDNQLFCTSISGSKIALGSVQNGGVLLFDLNNGSYKETFNLKNGLSNNTILSSFFDKDQNLWLGLDKGIGYVNLNSPIRPLFATTSPIGGQVIAR